MQRRDFLAAASIGIAATAGCASITGTDNGSDGESGSGDGSEEVERIELEDDAPEAAGAQTLRVPVAESIAGQTLSAVAATYPRERFVVDSASHDAITVGVDQDGDETLDEEFGSDAISGANNNAYSFTVTMDTAYELREGDVVILDYPTISNPQEAGEYDATVVLNDQQETTVSVAIE
ncbi:hypothetical protein [Halobellus limi]|uniref:Uncharacterized protein n=1 Tax=Halobellus limi TaxID=699433 RepID=A0A1H6C086_9EURY|nr:hypothetical protein [Halobellus limi]SEG66322.1 hypothetical protein SAMN04488133_3094 [Halobellus limi]